MHLVVFGVLTASQLHDQPGARTEEVGNIGTHGVLAAKAITCELFAA
jgi:hypothetical protein